MNVTNVKLNDIKSCKDLEKIIQKNIISKYYYAGISFKEVIEFINEVEDFKLQIFYPTTLEEDKILSYLQVKVKEEIINRIKTGELSLIKKVLDPYITFLSSTKNFEKAADIIENELCKLGIQNDWEILCSAYDNIEIIKRIINSLASQHQNQIESNDYSFTNKPAIIKLLKIYTLRNQNKTIKIQKSDAEIEFENKIATCEYAVDVKQFLLKHNINKRYLYIILLRCNIYSYEIENLENLSSCFGVSKERIALDQDKAIKWLFSNHLVESLIKLFPYPKETYNYFTELYKNGYSQKTQLVINVLDLKYNKPLTEITNLSKENMDSIIAKLNSADQDYIRKNYNENYILKHPKKYDRVKTMAIAKKITRAFNDMNYTPKSSKMTNLSILLDIPKENLEQLLKRFTESDQNFIYRIYTFDFDHRGRILSPSEKYRLNLIKRDLIELNNNPNFEPKNFKNLYLRLNITKEKLEDIIPMLSEEDQAILRNWYDKEWNECLDNKTNEGKKEISGIVKKLNLIISPKKERKSAEPKTLYNFYNITKEELQNTILKLSIDDQIIIKKYYTEDFILIDTQRVAFIKNKLKGIKSTIRKLINDPDYLNKIAKNKVERSRNKTALHKFYNISKEELQNIILKLTETDQIIIKKYYTEDYILIDNLSNEEYNKIKNNLRRIKITIKKLINDPEYLIKKQQKNRRKPKANTLYELLGISKEVLEELIKKLNEADKQLIKEHYEEDYSRIIYNGLTKEEYSKTNAKLYLVRQKLLRLHTDPNYKIQREPKQKEPKKRVTLYERLNITIEELIGLISKLSLEEQELLKEAYDENYCVFYKKVTDPEYETKRKKLAIIRRKLRNMVNPKPDKRHTLYETLDMSSEQLKELIKKLSNADQQKINENYDVDFKKITHTDLAKEEKAKLNQQLYVIRNKILRLHNDPNYMVRGGSKPKEHKEYVTLYKLLNITKEQLEILITKLPEEDQKLLKDFYDADFKAMRKPITDQKEAQLRNSRLSYIRKKIRNMINPKTDKRKKNLYKVLEITKEELETIIKKLSQEERTFIFSIYTKDFEPLPNNNLSKDQLVKNRNRMVTIRGKIRKYIENPKYKPTKNVKSLCQRLNVDTITANRLISLLDETEKTRLLATYDELNNYNRKDTATEEDKNFVNRTTIPKLKRYLTNGIKKSKRVKKNTVSLDTVIKSQISAPNDEKLNILELIIMMSLSTGETYSTSSIAKFLGIEESVVKDMIKNYLLNCQEKYNKAVEDHIKQLEEPLTLLREKK